MKTKKMICVFLTALLAVSLSGCSATRYTNGNYTAQLPNFSETGWKDTMEVVIDDGEIISIDWDAIYVDDSIPIRKKQYSKSGLYGMLVAGAVGEWYDQATAAESFVLKNGIDAFTLNEDGYTDAVAGCTVHVNDFDTLLRECLAQAKK